MENAFLYLAVCIASCALACFVSYDDERMRASRFALGAVLLASISATVISGIRELSDFDFDYAANDLFTSETVNKTIEEAFCDGIARRVEEEFSIKREYISVQCVGFDLENVRAERILITLRGAAAFKNGPAISKFVEQSGAGECIVEVDFE